MSLDPWWHDMTVLKLLNSCIFLYIDHILTLGGLHVYRTLELWISLVGQYSTSYQGSSPLSHYEHYSLLYIIANNWFIDLYFRDMTCSHPMFAHQSHNLLPLAEDGIHSNLWKIICHQQFYGIGTSISPWNVLEFIHPSPGLGHHM